MKLDLAQYRNMEKKNQIRVLILFFEKDSIY